ncbi:MAG TPA: hypothetical protein VF581_10435 [Flavobacterium sp.]|jgi:hypothetical protein
MMKTKNLIEIADIDMERIPAVIRHQFDLIKGRYRTSSTTQVVFFDEAFTAMYCNIADFVMFEQHQEYEDTKKLYNETIREKLYHYDNGFGAVGLDDIMDLNQEEREQICHIFSQVFNKSNKIITPGITRVKERLRLHNRNFKWIGQFINEYGHEVGVYMLCWKIVLNNPSLFLTLFRRETIKLYERPPIANKKKIDQFTLACYFAEGRILYNKTTRQCILDGVTFTNCTAVAKVINAWEGYVLDTCNDGESGSKNLYRNLKLMTRVYDHMDGQVAQVFLEKILKYHEYFRELHGQT